MISRILHSFIKNSFIMGSLSPRMLMLSSPLGAGVLLYALYMMRNEQSRFEVQMAFLGLFMTAWTNILVHTMVLATLAVTLIGFLVICTAFFKSAKGVIGLICVLLLCLGTRASFPYGHDSAGRIDRLGGELLSSPHVKMNLTQTCGGKDSLFLSAPASSQGHRYLALNRLGKSQMESEELLARINVDLNEVFPIIAAGRRGQTVQDGNTFELGELVGLGHNPVDSSLPKNEHHYFILSAGPEHQLKGKVFHGIVRDAHGELWLFQYGIGVSRTSLWDGEWAAQQLRTYPLAKNMWDRMAERITSRYTSGFLSRK